MKKKTRDIKLIKIDKVSFISEWILIAEGLSDVQVRSITNSVEGELREKAKVEPIRKEGINEAKWALLDYGDLIVNIFQPEIFVKKLTKKIFSIPALLPLGTCGVQLMTILFSISTLHNKHMSFCSLFCIRPSS